MHLKSIELVGYKSFAVKTRVDLEPGITGVIGPNGCGKSNIMESVRWCLGEMSWKSLRAGAMVDVIFAGTAKRPPLGMTEVTLVFDNTDNRLPVPYAEVTVSRRIYRSGESEYHLNKTQCRLRDIRELFLDTGVGGDGYAIIDQGGVDFVLSSKPEERRALFEEAAGVAKYKAKREEALRKLERVEVDMSRLQDSVALIEEQVRKLDSDARKAKLYTKYKEELAALEAAHLLAQLETLAAELAALSEAMKPVEDKLGAARTAMSAEGANLAALNLERASRQNLAVDCGGRIAEIKSQIGRLEERLAQSGQAIEEIARRRAECESELSAARARLEAADPEIDRARQALDESQAEAEAVAAEAQEAAAKAAAASNRLEDAQREGQALAAEVLAAADAALDKRRSFGRLESDWARREAEVRQNLRQLERDLAGSESVRGEIAAARSEAEVQRQRCEAARSEADAAEAAALEARRRQSAAADELMRVHSELAHARATSEAVESQGRQNPYWSGAQAVLNAGIPGVVGTVSQMLRCDAPAKALIEDVLGERLYAVVCEDSTAARAGVELLSASGKGRARFLVLSSLPSQVQARSYPPESKPILERVGFEARFEPAVRFLLAESYALDKAVFGDHWVFGGAPASDAAAVGIADTAELRGRVASLEGRLQEHQVGKVRAEEESARAEEDLRRAAEVRAQEEARASSLSEAAARKEQALEVALSNVQLSTEDCARMLAEMALTKEEMGVCRGAISGCEERERSLRQSQRESDERAAACRDELSRATGAEGIVGARLNGLEEKRGMLEREFSRLAVEKESLEAVCARRDAELSELSRRREEALARGRESREGLEALAVDLKALEVEAQGISAQLVELDRQAAEKEASLRALKEETDGLQQELHRLELDAGGKKSRSDVLKNRLWDEWQLTLEEAKARSAGQAVEVERIEMLRKRLANMGNINLAAPEEYEALSSRQAFLAGQIEDLSKAKEDLRSAISKINGSTRENFRQTYEEVRGHFRRLYGVLFEGGEADLVLTEPDNILETGVDIVAQPPGKRLQSISLLSGGEKALTAIALLFAFFMVRPSPFCMLDEADAALDDANVERFVSLLKEFQSRSQFLIVSHNKRTMEAADVIYGVTMEEMGVSQLVSVDFRKKGERAKPAAEPAAEARQADTASEAA